MLMSSLYAPTLREVPADAEIVSHQLMLRGGFIRKATGGIYTYLPLALRVLKKIEQIVREEMDAAGGQELLMPITQPAEMWQESGRWSVYGDEMWRLTDRHGRPFCLGPTHEEMITTLIRGDVRSYRQLPIMLYQIQNKYRDERRPRFGLMRGREFIMKDLYSFDKDEEGLDISYKKMYDAYSKIFSRCGLNYRPVEADSGAIGGSGSHEFMAIATSGEAEIVYCDTCNYAANVEKAELKVLPSSTETTQSLELVDTPNIKTIEEICTYLNITKEKTIKTVFYRGEYKNKTQLIMALVRGDHEVNEIKVLNESGAIAIEMANEEDILSINSAGGYLGPIGNMNVMVIADINIITMSNAVCGANIEGKHYKNVNPQRDFKISKLTDIRLIQNGDPCPRCGGIVSTARGIEVGQVFKLFTKYSKTLKATFLNENGKEFPMVMGCYGIGVSRTMAAIIEQSYDENGIIWPISTAPYHVVIIPANTKDEAVMNFSDALYKKLLAAKVEVVFDERNERAGVKFKDADLIGYPLRITVGAKTLAEDFFEVKIRRNGEIIKISTTEENIVLKIKNLLQD